jgi:Ca2+/Na+ antiporter
MTISKKAPYIIFAIALIINGIIAVIFWRTIRESIVSPISALVLLIIDFLSSFDQIYLWIFLLFGLFILTVIRLGKTSDQEPTNRVVHLKVTSAGRLRFWDTQVFLLTRTRIPSRYSIHEVRRLLISVMGYKMHLEPTETDRRLKAGELEMPAEYAIFAEQDHDPEEPEDRLTELVRLLMSVLQGKRSQVTLAREKNLSDLIQYMEKQMEIEHDH